MGPSPRGSAALEDAEGGLAELRTQFPWYASRVRLLTLGVFNPIDRQYYVKH